MPKSDSDGDLINRMYELREDRRAAQGQVDELQREYKELEAELLDRLNERGVDQSRGDLATVSVSQTEVPSVSDWNKLNRWIARNKRYDLYERRISKSAWQEELALRKGKNLPGVETYTRVTLNLRAR